MKLTVDPRKICAVAIVMSTEEYRYYLNGVHLFERDAKLIYEATDGHRLIRVTDNKPQGEINGLNIIIPAEIINLLPGRAPIVKFFDEDEGVAYEEEEEYPRLELDVSAEKRLSFHNLATQVTISALAIDGKFPDTDAVFPKETSCRALDYDVIGLQPRYIASFGYSLDHFGDSCECHFAFSKEPGNPVYLRHEAQDGSFVWEALCMPQRLDKKKAAA